MKHTLVKSLTAALIAALLPHWLSSRFPFTKVSRFAEGQ